MSLGSFIGRALSSIGSAFGDEGRLRYHYGDNWRDSARILSEMKEVELEREKKSLQWDEELKNAQIVGHKVRSVQDMIDMSADTAADNEQRNVDQTRTNLGNVRPGGSVGAGGPLGAMGAVAEQLAGMPTAPQDELMALPKGLEGVISQPAFEAASRAAGSRKRKEWELKNATAAAAMARASRYGQPSSQEQKTEQAIEAFTQRFGRPPMDEAEALSWFNKTTSQYPERVVTTYDDPSNPRIRGLVTGGDLGRGRPVPTFDARGLPVPVAGGAPAESAADAAARMGAATDLPGGGYSAGGAPSPAAPAAYLTRPTVAGQATRERAGGIMQALDMLERDVAPLLKEARDVLGPVRGRLAEIQMEKLGGYGLSSEQISVLTRLRTLLTSQAFADGGKQLTNTELGLFAYTSPSPADTFEQAMVKAQLLRQALYSRGRNMILGEPPAARPQLSDFARRLRLYKADPQRGESFDGGSTWFR